MTARLRRTALLASATAGIALLGASVQGVAAMNGELRSSVRALPVVVEGDPLPVTYDGRDCTIEDRVVLRGREV